MKILLIINFDTGDVSVPYYDVPVIVKTKGFERFDYATFEDGCMSYLNSPYSDDKDYDEMISDILNESGYEWKFVTDKIPECDNYKIMYL